MEGGTEREYAVSQMLLAESEDIYAQMQKCVPTCFVPLEKKLGKEGYDHFWAETLPAHLAKLDVLCAQGVGFEGTPGGLYLFSMLHQCALVKPDVFDAAPGQPGALAHWYKATLGKPAVERVLKGESSAGEFVQYFVAA